MKKYLFRSVFLIVLIVSAAAIYLSCTDDNTTSFDLTGTWFGMGVPPNGAAFIELHAVQDSATGNVTGTLYILGSNPDTAIISGTVSNGHFTGVASGVECPADVDLDIGNDGTALVGHAVDQVSANCSADFVYLTMFKDLPVSVNLTGTWSGTHTSTQGNGSFGMVLNQNGATVSGVIYDTDTTAINGKVFGNIFAGTISDPNCPILILMEVSSNSMSGSYANTGEGQGECLDKGTVTANR